MENQNVTSKPNYSKQFCSIDFFASCAVELAEKEPPAIVKKLHSQSN